MATCLLPGLYRVSHYNFTIFLVALQLIFASLAVQSPTANGQSVSSSQIVTLSVIRFGSFSS